MADLANIFTSASSSFEILYEEVPEVEAKNGTPFLVTGASQSYQRERSYDGNSTSIEPISLGKVADLELDTIS